ncbi:Hemerythrin domain protein [hydrothermal vent metagenome]|uniref:Hemerythrin domain protein n=1 Tax=hydrothermal vent metagenome TaxID=652676 RepID=A0A3B0UKY4_9ZZZZ
MSELINNTEQRIKQLHAFFSGIIRQQEKGALLIKTYEKSIEQVQPFDVVAVVDILMKEDLSGEALQKLKKGINRSLNMLYKGLVSREIPKYEQKPFFGILQQENNALNDRLIALRPFIKAFNEKDADRQKIVHSLSEIKKRVEALQEFNLHYVKMENILFPYIEKHLPEYGCLPLMWSYHDDIRNMIKDTVAVIGDGNTDLKRLNRLLGDLFFNMYAIRFREEYILFPVVFDMIPQKEIHNMLEQAFDMGFAFIEPPSKIILEGRPAASVSSKKGDSFLSMDELGDRLLDFDTGRLTISQAVIMLNHLPVDVTFVDENDEVRYFSTPGDRIFPRSKAIIGRLVENCHPPSSVHIVKELIDSFRKGEKQKESFWIQVGGKFVLIQYFALHDKEGRFRGTLEVSQDVTDIRKLDGEKRLME